jgi:cell shape-determining protein MreC
MLRFNKIAYVLLMGFMVSGLVMMTGCKKAGTSSAVAGGTVQSTSAKLEEVKASVAEAEKKLGELRAERIRLENELKEKKNGNK